MRKITQPLHTQKSRNLSTHKIRQPYKKKSRNLSTKKIMQPLHKTVVTVVTVVIKKTFFNPKIFSQKNFFFTKKPLHNKNQSTSLHKKSRNLFTQKIMRSLNKKVTQPFRKKSHATSGKYCKNWKTLP